MRGAMNGTKPNSMDKTRDTQPIRLNRYLAMLGAGSRRACDDLILQGKVEVDGDRVRDPGLRVTPGQHQITVDRVPLERPASPLVLILNKPTGFVSTASDPMGRPTVLDLCKKYARKRRLFPVGRLDFNTTGVLLLTNDGILCYRLTHPRFAIPRTYQARVRGAVDEGRLATMRRLAGGGRRKNGADRPASSVDLVKRLGRESVIQITLHEGKNRQVRKMCETVGLRVVKLRRTRFGPLSVRNLPLGAVRPLTPKELARLTRLAS
jgi:23S rRNA pseudouridine2605 synthase